MHCYTGESTFEHLSLSRSLLVFGGDADHVVKQIEIDELCVVANVFFRNSCSNCILYVIAIDIFLGAYSMLS